MGNIINTDSGRRVVILGRKIVFPQVPVGEDKIFWAVVELDKRDIIPV